MSAPGASGDRVPPAAAWLGGAGLLPFVAGAAGVWVLEEPRHGATVSLLSTYAAVILSFMGAIHWGLAMRGPDRSQARVMGLSVLPALLAWFALALPPVAAMVLMGAGFLGVYALDARAIAVGLAPPWYRRLRIPLTAGVFACLALAVAALLLRGAS